MSAPETTCPFCNSRVNAAPGPAGKAVCPRCGESFAVSADIKAAPAITPAPDPAGSVMAGLFPEPPPPGAPKPVRANRTVAAVILGVMALMAGASLAYALLTQDMRRKHDKELVKRPSRRPALDPVKPEEREREKKPLPPVDPVAPARLAALGYLPPQTGVVVGLHAQEMLASDAGRDLRGKGIKVAKLDLRLDAVKDALGLAAEDIDHAVLGIVVRELEVPDATPPIHLVVRARAPLDTDRLLGKLEAGKPRQEKMPGGRRAVYPVKVQGLPMNLWLADEKTVVLGVFSRLEAVPAKPAEGIGHLPAEVREVIGKRLGVGTPLWVAGHAEDWSKTWVPALVGMFPDVPLGNQLEKVKTFTIGVVPEKPVKVQGSFRCADEAAAKELEAKELAPRAKKEGGAFKYSRDGAWLDVQWKVAMGK